MIIDPVIGHEEKMVARRADTDVRESSYCVIIPEKESAHMVIT
jgi:hypothetical protein